MATNLLRLDVSAVTDEAEDIKSYELVDPEGHDLPPFTAGAHIDVHVDGLIRQYSLANDPEERHRYVIGVLFEAAGRGGSKAMHQSVRVGNVVLVSEPRNNFPLAEDASRHLLLAGGIGVTPLVAMVTRLRTTGAEFTMHYCTRSPEKTAFMDKLSPLVAEGRVVVHHDGGDPSQGLDIAALLERHEPGTHLYYCGPPGFMAAAEKAATHWPKGTVHFEYFTLPEEADPAAAEAESKPFQIKVASSGNVHDVPADKTIVDVLLENGVDVETSCESGLCGTCRTRYLEGDPEHHDMVLEDDEQAEYVMVCCARSKGPLLVLDL